MPNAPFVPLVGSSFDALANQGQYWAGFNQQTDAQNLARQAAAEQAQNQWFSNLAQMQTQENARRDSADRQAAEHADRVAQQQAQDRLQAGYAAEQARQFDLGQSFKTKELTWKETKDDTERKRGEVQLANYALNIQPSVHEAGTALDKAKEAADTATEAFTTKLTEAKSIPNFPASKAIFKNGGFEAAYNKVTGKPEALDANEEAAVRAANEYIGKATSDAMIAKQNMDRADAQWKYIQAKQLDPRNLIVKKDKDGTYTVYSPELAKGFKQLVAEAKAKPYDPTGGGAFVPTSPGSDWLMPKANGQGGGDVAGSTAAPFIPRFDQGPAIDSGMNTGVNAGVTAAGGGPVMQWVANQMYPPSGTQTEPPTSAPSTSSPPAPFIPNDSQVPSSTSQTWKNIMQLPAAGLRAANYVLAGPGPNPSSGGLTLSGLRDAAVGDSNQWVPPQAGNRLPPIIKTKAQRDALPAGTAYIGPDGKTYVKGTGNGRS